MGWVVNTTPRPLYHQERDSVPIVQEARWAPGSVWSGVENFAVTGIQSLDRLARSESLHRLSYFGLPEKLLALHKYHKRYSNLFLFTS